MTCFQEVISKIRSKCRNTLGLKSSSKHKRVEISAPFDFKEGPAVNFPGYSEDDISLMREKAIASTAIVEDGEFDLASRIQRPRSRASSFGCGLGGRVVYHARRLSKGNIY
ncbi:uncharacterized protein K444DRAFT_347709 [Hyaloscypha bicolor E]|uniref:Uncharacterized protein n=1 Tax=Hyaloscypha bicolor E TaxID=1095630 RepID=A0A2J6TI30_9HELO|nr:uncharacterized protein K444DRAFT_347709 [Hyaloscypha bicolor E]PMD62682.1 hypothetical protein K444DRAFT_347709 [Hyaloscypha bicolor E]